MQPRFIPIATVFVSLAAAPLSGCSCSSDSESESGETAAPAGAGGTGGVDGGSAGRGGSSGASNAGNAGSAGAGQAGASAAAGSAGSSDGGGDAGEAGAGGSAGAADNCDLLGVPGVCLDPAACVAMASHTSTLGLCSGSSAGECCTPFGPLLCDPMAMPRPQPNAGKTSEAPGVGGCPNGMIPISTFCIDQYEATLVRVDDSTPWSPYDNPGTVAVRALSVVGTIPQAYIDGVQAADACANAGKRLCTDSEWLRACQGPAGSTYPYGDTRSPGQCNDARSEHPAVEYFGTSDSFIYAMLDNSCLDQLPQTVAPTGSLSACVSSEGAFDMMGNLSEWTADPAGTFRGGSYLDTALNGPGCLYTTTAHDTLHWDFLTGFRCCADPS